MTGLISCQLERRPRFMSALLAEGLRMVTGCCVHHLLGLSCHSVACRSHFLGSGRGQPTASHLHTADAPEMLGDECYDTSCFTWV